MDFDSYRKWGGKDPRSKIANEANILLEGVKCEIDRLPCRIEVPATLNIWVGWAPESDDLPAISRPEGRGRVVVIGWDVEPSIASVWGGIFGDEGLEVRSVTFEALRMRNPDTAAALSTVKFLNDAY